MRVTSTNNHLIIGAIMFLAIAAVLAGVLLFGRLERAAMAGAIAGGATESCLGADGTSTVMVDAASDPVVETACGLPEKQP